MVLELAGQGRPDPAAAHDHEVHDDDGTAGQRRWGTDAVAPGRAWRSPPRPRRRRPGPAGLAWGLVPDITEALKRALVGRPMRSERLGSTLLPKRLALPVFASDALSSVAYAPDEILLTLALAGVAAITISPWIGLVVVVVLLTVVASYRQTVHAYPSGGGDYEVATENLGRRAGLTVASALLVDYVLTVAVSISSAAQYLSAAIPAADGHEVAVGRQRRRHPRPHQPARAARVRPRARRAGLPLHGLHRAHGRRRVHPERAPARCARRSPPGWTSCRRPATSRGSSGWPGPSSCCARSPPGRRP